MSTRISAILILIACFVPSQAQDTCGDLSKVKEQEL